MLLSLSVALSLVASVLACTIETHSTICPPSTIKVVIRSHRNQTSSWQTSSINQAEENENPWRMIVEHRTIVDSEGKSLLETVINLRAQRPGQVNIAEETGNEAQNRIEIGEDKPPTTPAHVQTEMFPLNYQHFPGVGHYKFHHDVTTWPTARERCAQEGGHLVILNSEAELEVVKTMFAANPTSPGSSNTDQLHAGLKRVGDGKYATIFGVPIEETGFSEWHPGQPSSGANEPCVSIMKKKIITAYNDISCKIQILAYICEVELQ